MKIKPKKNTLKNEIDKAIESFRRKDYDNIPENKNREFSVGDDVFVGFLKECKVEQILEDGKFIVFSFLDKGSSRGTTYNNGRKFRVSPWIDLMPSVEQIDRFGKTHVIHNTISSGLSSIIHNVYHRGIINNPDYQRGYAWTEEDKKELIKSIFEGCDIGKFIFINKPHPENRLEVLDGKQRLSAIMGYIEGYFKYKGFFFHELSRADQRAFKSLMIQSIELDGDRTSKKEILKLFLTVNHAGVPQTAGHIAKIQEMYDEL